MTAIVVIPLDKSIIFAADGIAYDPATGKAGGYRSKIELLPHLDCIIGTAGCGGMAQALNMAMSVADGFSTFDEIVDRMPELAEYTYGELVKTGRTGGYSSLVVFGGWSQERQRFEAYKLRSEDYPAARGTDEVEAWRCYEIDGAWLSTTPDPETLRRFDLYSNEGSPLDYAARAVCAARSISGLMEDPITGEKIHYAAGGFLQMAELRRGHISSWIAHRWPDTAGESVDPSSGEPMPAFPLQRP